jgi:hypothetical protein
MSIKKVKMRNEVVTYQYPLLYLQYLYCIVVDLTIPACVCHANVEDYRCISFPKASGYTIFT